MFIAQWYKHIHNYQCARLRLEITIIKAWAEIDNRKQSGEGYGGKLRRKKPIQPEAGEESTTMVWNMMRPYCLAMVDYIVDGLDNRRGTRKKMSDLGGGVGQRDTAEILAYK